LPQQCEFSRDMHQQNHKIISAFWGLSATFPFADKSQQAY